MAKRHTRGICHRRFDGIVKINERIPPPRKCRELLFFSRVDRRFAVAGTRFSETMRHPEHDRTRIATLSKSRERNRLKIFGRRSENFSLLTFAGFGFVMAINAEPHPVHHFSLLFPIRYLLCIRLVILFCGVANVIMTNFAEPVCNYGYKLIMKLVKIYIREIRDLYFLNFYHTNALQLK